MLIIVNFIEKTKYNNKAIYLNNMEKLNFIIKSEYLSELTDAINDLTKISEIVKIKIDKDNIFIYSLVGESVIIAFKSYKLETNKFFKFKEELEKPIDFIILKAKKFVKNVNFLIDQEDIKATFSYIDRDEDNICARGLRLVNSKFKFTEIGAENYKIRDISINMLESILDEDNVDWKFQISDEDYKSIKKLSSINNEKNILNIGTKSGNIIFGEDTTWEINVGEIAENKKDITFPKKYLKTINNEEDIINFYVYETFILFKEGDKNLMVSFEQDFDSEEFDY